MTSNALEHWTHSLQQWGIPQNILDAAPQSPWIHPVSTFTPQGNLYVDVPSRHRALEILANGGSVLDIGCGGGRAAFGLVPPATHVIGVDHQQEMLDVFADQATQRGISCDTVLGDWPDVSDITATADVVVCHHVFYNVQNLAPFVHALSSHARKRVVVEIPTLHPLSSLSAMWKEFWNLDRPTSPSSLDALAVVRALGYDAHLEEFVQESEVRPVTNTDVEFTRIRLCLTADRDTDIRAYLESHPVTQRHLATIWWDV